MKTLQRLFWMGILGLVLSPSLPAQDFGTLRGEVTDRMTGKPLPGANVVLEKTVLGTSADARGVFVLGRIRQGNYSVTVSRVGYLSITRDNVRILAGDTTTLVFGLE
jgi:hypothetical protein